MAHTWISLYGKQHAFVHGKHGISRMSACGYFAHPDLFGERDNREGLPECEACLTEITPLPEEQKIEYFYCDICRKGRLHHEVYVERDEGIIAHRCSTCGEQVELQIEEYTEERVHQLSAAWGW